MVACGSKDSPKTVSPTACYGNGYGQPYTQQYPYNNQQYPYNQQQYGQYGYNGCVTPGYNGYGAYGNQGYYNQGYNYGYNQDPCAAYSMQYGRPFYFGMVNGYMTCVPY